MAFASRDEIDPRYTWDLSDIFPDDASFAAALDEARAYPAACEAFKGTIARSPERLLAFLELDDEISLKLTKLISYSNRKSDEDTRNAHYQDLSNQVMVLAVAISSAASWFTSELLTIPEEEMASFYERCPQLALYRRRLDLIFARRAHTLSEKEEAILAQAEDMASQPGAIFSLINDADLSFDDAIDAQGVAHPVSHGSYTSLMSSSDRSLRKSAYESLHRSYEHLRNGLSAVLAAQCKSLKFYAEARRYPSTLAYSLDGTEVPTSVYHQLIETVHAHLPSLHRYMELRRKLLGVDELHFYDVHAPLISGVDLRFSYEEACEMTLAALAPLGPEYEAIVRKGLQSRWVDVYETPGKRSGAYSAGGYGIHPVILMNYQGKLEDLFTLVHEMGHSVHTYLSCESQPICYADYVIFVAEVASTCNEALLIRHLLDTAPDPKTRAYLVVHFLEQFRTTLFRQCMFAEFELKINEMCEQGQSLTADALCALYRQLNEDYYGPAIIVDDAIALEWARIPHFYYRYYVYQYATGFAAAIALSKRILEEGEPAVEDYLGFLRGGCSKPPIELLRGAGVDMASPEPIDEALAVFSELLEELSGYDA